MTEVEQILALIREEARKQLLEAHGHAERKNHILAAQCAAAGWKLQGVAEQIERGEHAMVVTRS